ncbi:nucleoside hydrolase [Bernardetia sp.]|uniref:nucleoside hydrolase n=1 Tax=Bernardetia sp. TaxID=1937974 RepID=UPI0025C5A03E|nr:nucleoside hydrolase [Bernardetia sp.]
MLQKLPVVFDMETNDPDDYITLLFLLGHPRIELKAVTITPGSVYQVGLVERTLQLFGKDIPIGAYYLEHPKNCVSEWHQKVYGKIEPSDNAERGCEILLQNCDEETTLITGAPLKNLGLALEFEDFKLGRLVAQGGFAGEGVVPLPDQLPKFRGKKTCPTFNLNGDIPSALKTLETSKIKERYFVSKNVCHGVIYDRQMNQILEEILNSSHNKSLSLKLIHKGMSHYLQKKKDGKKLHDPLAACCAIEKSIGNWSEVELFMERGEWGARLQQNTNTYIITSYDHQQFLRVFFEH